MHPPGSRASYITYFTTAYLGIKTLIARSDYKLISNSDSLIVRYLFENNTAKDLGFYAGHFVASLAVTFLIELEYRETIPQLYSKERKLERKINEIIAELKKK
jgi:hypothetical protein